MVIMLKGENGKRVIESIKAKIASLHLPPGVRLIPFYDQSDVIDGTIHTVERNLFEGFILVTIVLLLFLGNLRAALLTAMVIPLSMLVSFLGMRAFGITANLMSLGAIDFGMIVDGAIVMMENSVHRLEVRPRSEEPTLDSVRIAAREVARPMVFGVAIIIAVYLADSLSAGPRRPHVSPHGHHGLLGSIGFLGAGADGNSGACLSCLSIRPRGRNRGRADMEHLDRGPEPAIRERARFLFSPSRSNHRSLRARAFGLRSARLFFIGTEFMPRLDEGSILVETRKLPGISLTDSVEISKRIESSVARLSRNSRTSS